MFNEFEALLDRLLIKMCKAIKKNKHPAFTNNELRFLDDSQKTALLLIKKLTQSSEEPDYQMACSALFTQALTSLRFNYERNEIWAKRLYSQIGDVLIQSAPHCSTACVINIIHAFYEARLEVPEDFKELSLDVLAPDEADMPPPEELYANGQRMIEALFEGQPDATSFELSDVLFQSLHAMPPEVLRVIVNCLIVSPRTAAQNAAVFFLLHPNSKNRVQAINLLSELFEHKSLTPESLRRLITIRQWSPDGERQPLDGLIARQRKRGGLFAETPKPPALVRYEASMFDGAGVQLILFETQEGKQHRLGGLLVKHEVGIRDAWITPHIPLKELRAIKKQMQQEHPLTMLQVDSDYVARIVSHYISLNNNNGETPEPHLLEIYEHLGAQDWRAEPTSIEILLSTLIAEVNPDGISPAWIEQSLERSGNWMGHEKFTESWFEVSPSIDALINRHTTLMNGTHKIKRTEALQELSNKGFEAVRHKWIEIFSWMALMAKYQSIGNNPMLWKDFTTLAYVLHQEQAMHDIPLMRSIIHDSLSISIDSMKERGTHLQ